MHSEFIKPGIVMPWHPEVPFQFFEQAVASARSQVGPDGKRYPLSIQYTEHGAPYALNRGVKELFTQGCTHAFFHSSDDFLLRPTSVQEHAAKVDPEQTVFVCGGVRVVEADGLVSHIWPASFNPETIVQHPNLAGGALYSIQALRRVPFLEGVRGMEDYLWFIEATRLGYLTESSVAFTEEAHYCHRQRPGQVTRRWWDEPEYRKGVLDDVRRVHPALADYMAKRGVS